MAQLFFVLFLLAIAVSGCATKGRGEPNISGELLLFEDKVPGKKTMLTRMLLSKRYIRVDENFDASTEKDNQRYTVYDRQLKIFYFVDRDSLFTEEVNLQGAKKKPQKVTWQIESEQSQAVVRNTDTTQTKATYYRFKIDNQACYNLVALSPAMSEAYEALREYRIAWATYLREFKEDMPEMSDNCFRAVVVDDPETILSHGFPTREWSANGRQRFMVDFRPNMLFADDVFKTSRW